MIRDEQLGVTTLGTAFIVGRFASALWTEGGASEAYPAGGVVT